MALHLNDAIPGSMKDWLHLPLGSSTVCPCSGSLLGLPTTCLQRLSRTYASSWGFSGLPWTPLRARPPSRSIGQSWVLHCHKCPASHPLCKVQNKFSDSPIYTQAINSPHAEKWWEAMESEWTTLESELQAWELVPREPWMHVLLSTWAFCLRRFPNGLAKKFKTRFIIRGGRQVEGVDFFETWAPVVQWTTVWSVMVWATRMNLVSAQDDITAAFPHAPLGPDEHIYAGQHAGFQHDGDLVLKLKKSVYGLRQSPWNFFNGQIDMDQAWKAVTLGHR
eukprot:CCRYP_014116-RA/>CCRYP_014116-RA protein AED:0.21 eAED:0.11 QI:0/0/0/0.5/1/1/2/0/277